MKFIALFNHKKMPLIIIPLELTPLKYPKTKIYPFNKNDVSFCRIEDGTHKAHVEYFNPETAYHAWYTLDVKVENCKVKQIDFPKGGWLDESHISPTLLDECGNATVEDDQGRIYDVDLISLNKQRS